jgi:midasin (ATPase involved in ribosome maturation)
MSVDFKTFIKVTPYVTAVRKPVLVRGRHGVGKSQVVYQLAKGLGLPVVERRASQMTEGDLLGLPSTDGNVTSWNPPEWYKTACTHAVVLFLDEVDRATSEVRQGIFELTDSRKLAGFTLHQDTLIFAAVNGGEHGEQYQVGEMDPAELDRWTVFDVEPTTEDWLDWAGDNVHSVVWNFINQNHTHLEHKDDYEPNKVYPSRRSWHRLSECLAAGSLLDEGSDSSIVFNLTNSFVGFEAAVAFKDFVDNYERQVTVEDILDDGKIELTADFGINEHAALITKMEQSKDFQEKLSAERVQNLANYYITLPSEVAMKLWTILGQGHQANSVALHQSKTADGKSVSAFIVELLTGEESK